MGSFKRISCIAVLIWMCSLSPCLALDQDSDGVDDAFDNCLIIANPDQGNIDGDANGDACDDDADGDGVINIVEVSNGTDPLDPTSSYCLKAGCLDPRFGGGDGISPVTGSIHVAGRALAVRSDGKILIAGRWMEQGSDRVFLTRLNSDGTKDLSFGESGNVFLEDNWNTVDISDIELQRDGKVLVSGYTRNYTQVTQHAMVARFHENGVLDNNFGNNNGLLTIFHDFHPEYDANDKESVIYAISLQNDGKLLVALEMYYFATYPDPSLHKSYVLRFDVNGLPDLGFGSGDGIYDISESGIDTNSSVFGSITDIDLTSDGSIVAASSKGSILKLTASGALDTTFAGGMGLANVPLPVQSYMSGVKILLDSEDKILLSGFSQSESLYVSRFNSNGLIDDTFGEDGVFLYDTISEPTGRDARLVAGIFSGSDNNIYLSVYCQDPPTPATGMIGIINKLFLFRLTSVGSLDGSFGNGGIVATQYFSDNVDTSLYSENIFSGTRAAASEDGNIVVIGPREEMSTCWSGPCMPSVYESYILKYLTSDIDPDSDGVPLPEDNCPAVANADQADSNGNGIGDRCDALPPCEAPESTYLPARATNGTYTLRWSGSTTGAAVYQVEESVDGGPWSLVANNLTTTSLPFSGKGNGSYQYRVKASAEGHADSSWLTGSAITVQLACAASAGIAVPATSMGGYAINWTASNTADALYQLEERANGGSWLPFANNISGTSYNVTNKANGSYEYRVKVTKDGYTDSIYRNSNIMAVKQPVATPCATPGSLYVPTSSTTGSFTVKWLRSSTTGAVYQLEERKNSDSWVSIGSNLSANYVNLTGRTTGGYEYRIKATKDGFGPSGWKVSTPCAIQ